MKYMEAAKSISYIKININKKLGDYLYLNAVLGMRFRILV